MTNMIKSTKTLRNLLIIAFAFVIAFSSVTPTYAANNSPYGFTFDDTANGKTIYRFYSYSANENSYVQSREFYSRGSYVYSSNGVLLCNTSVGNGSRYQGFDSKGQFYIVSSKGTLTKIDIFNKATVLLEKGAIRLNYNLDDLATTITTSVGTKYLSTLAPAPEVDDDEDYTPAPVVKEKNRVDIYTNSANELVYDAYKNGSLKTQMVVSSNGKNVLNATAKVRLSDTLKGAKFLGFDSSYNVYLYETNTLYRFKSGSWYSAEKLALNGSYKSFKKDDKGFISKVVTTKSSYTVKQLTTSSKWKAKKTYTVSKSGYVTLYTKGSTRTNTLTLKSRQLNLNGKKIASGVSRYGFVSSKKLIFMKGRNVYTAYLSSPTKAKKLFTNGTSLKKNSVGLITKVATTKGTKKVS